MTTTGQTGQTTTPQQLVGALLDPANRANPYPILHQLREAGPFPVRDGAMTVLGDHERLSTMLRDPALSSDRTRSLLPARFVNDNERPRPVSFLSMDAPDHTRLRKLVAKAFTPRVIAALEPRIEAVVAELFAAFAADGQFDVVAQLAYPLPVRIICELLGVPPADHERFEHWSRLMSRGLDPALAVVAEDELAAIAAAQAEFADYFRELIARRRGEPGEDLLSKLILIEEQGDQLTEPELVSTCMLLLIAGHETTANLIANGVLNLLRHPDQLAALRADRTLVAGTVEEVLRFDPPVQMTTRIVRQPTTIGAVEVPADGLLLMLLAAANRDPAVFTEPDRFDIRRTEHGHLSFAAGPHFCLGAGLARLEAGIALSAFVDRLVEPTVDEAAVHYRAHVNLRGPAVLPIEFAAAR